MDNGLIFPYRRRTVHTELVILTTRTTVAAFCVASGGERGA